MAIHKLCNIILPFVNPLIQAPLHGNPTPKLRNKLAPPLKTITLTYLLNYSIYLLRINKYQKQISYLDNAIE